MNKNAGKKKYWPFGVALFVLLGLLIFYRSYRVHKISGWRDPVIEMHDQKINELERKSKDFSKLMDEAEKMDDKIRYMEFSKKIALNQIELDEEWKLLHESLRTRQLKNQKLPKTEPPISPVFKVFTEEEKLEMLAKEYALDSASLKLLKTQIGTMFAHEFRTRFLEEIHDTLTAEDLYVRDLNKSS